MLGRQAQISKELRILAHGDGQRAKHLADKIAPLSCVTFLAALFAIAWTYAETSLGQVVLDPLNGGESSDMRETPLLLMSLVATLAVITGMARLSFQIIQSEINIGAWITAHDQP